MFQSRRGCEASGFRVNLHSRPSCRHRHPRASLTLYAWFAHGPGKRGLAHGPGRPRGSRATSRWAGCLSPLSARSTQAQSALNQLARFWEGEPPGEPSREPARTEPRPPGITKGHLESVLDHNPRFPGILFVAGVCDPGLSIPRPHRGRLQRMQRSITRSSSNRFDRNPMRGIRPHDVRVRSQKMAGCCKDEGFSTGSEGLSDRCVGLDIRNWPGRGPRAGRCRRRRDRAWAVLARCRRSGCRRDSRSRKPFRGARGRPRGS